MTEIFFITRGHLDEVQRMVNDLHAQHMQQEFFDIKTNKNTKVFAQCYLRPIQFWGWDIPKGTTNNVDNFEVAINTLRAENSNYGLPKFVDNVASKAMRKAIGLKKLPPINEKGLCFPVHGRTSFGGSRARNGIQVWGIGYKDDPWGWTDNLGRPEGNRDIWQERR